MSSFRAFPPTSLEIDMSYLIAAVVLWLLIW